MRALGEHVLAELCDCDAAALDDERLIRAAMLEAARRCGATVVTDCIHRFSPHGVSGVVVIAESHLTIHTWPEHGYAAVDLFTCGARLQAEAGLAYLADALSSRRRTVQTVRRGAAARVPTITVLNGSLGGARGNTAAALAPLLAELRRAAHLRELHLADEALAPEALEPLLLASDAFVLATGTYWDSWGSPLQRFLEAATRFESGRAFLGKPAAILVTMHSVGGKGVLSRLQGVLSTLGCLLPPMSGMVYSLANDLALRHAPAEAAPFLADLWQLDELSVLGHNLLEAARGGTAWRSWRVDDGDAARRWLRAQEEPET